MLVVIKSSLVKLSGQWSREPHCFKLALSHFYPLDVLKTEGLQTVQGPEEN